MASRRGRPAKAPVRYLDTNVIIRYLTRDHPDQAARARELFERAGSGALTLHLPEAAIVETVNVLSSRVTYNLPRDEVRRHVENVLSLPGVRVPLRVPLRATYLRAVSLWAQTPAVRDFVDVLHVAHMERLEIRDIASFDADFDRFPQITRREP